jgi:hypothetical protein
MAKITFNLEFIMCASSLIAGADYEDDIRDKVSNDWEEIIEDQMEDDIDDKNLLEFLKSLDGDQIMKALTYDEDEGEKEYYDTDPDDGDTIFMITLPVTLNTALIGYSEGEDYNLI